MTFVIQVPYVDCVDDKSYGGQVIVTDEAMAEHGSRPDYGSGPYLSLLVEMVRLAVRDLSHPRYSQEARKWLQGLPCRCAVPGISIELIAEALGFERSSSTWMSLIAE